MTRAELLGALRAAGLRTAAADEVGRVLAPLDAAEGDEVTRARRAASAVAGLATRLRAALAAARAQRRHDEESRLGALVAVVEREERERLRVMFWCEDDADEAARNGAT